MMRFGTLAGVALVLAAPAVAAQDRAGNAPDQRLDRPAKRTPDAPKPPRRFRVTLGPQFQPGFPGNDAMRLNPMLNLSRARGDTPFRFSAPGDGNAISLLRTRSGFEFGPLGRLEGRRREGDLGGGLPIVDRTVEVGGFVQQWLGERIRLRGDLRKGLGGHKGLVSQIGADYVLRDGDRWLISAGPRVTLADARYQRAWFGVTPAAATATGLPEFRPGGGLNSVGITSRGILQVTPRWGVMANVAYARLAEDAARSPIIRRADSQNQLTAGLGLTYTFSVR